MAGSAGVSFGGVATALLFFWLSLTPSLLPRGWVLQGVVGGICAALGYGAGVAASRALHLLPWASAVRATPAAWRALALAGLGLSLTFLHAAAGWQRAISGRLGADVPAAGAIIAAVALAAVLVVSLLAATRALRSAARTLGGVLGRWLRPRVAGVTGTALVVVVTFGILDGVVELVLLRAADGFFQVVNETAGDELAPPTSSLRSGGPGSLVAWDGLGVAGQQFVNAAPTVSQIGAFTGRPAREPIRVYAGLGSADEVDERADLAIAELERTGAFDRTVLCVFATTGTGWINPTAAQALEYMYGGDVALVALQYSYLPSWISFLVDQSRAAEAGEELFGRVYRRWAQLPEDQRPLLLVYGESLGSFATEAAFDGLADMRSRLDGALFVGPMNFNPLWRDLVAARDAGSPQRLPVVEGGRTVRFAAGPDDLARPGPGWPAPRVVYLQHASDPVVWWTPRLAVSRPDWLAEPRGDDVLPAVRWYPGVTFWQVAADLAVAGRVPSGHGHLYGSLLVDAWAAIAPPPGWGPPDTQRLQRLLQD